jgi:hypothetical protein
VRFFGFHRDEDGHYFATNLGFTGRYFVLFGRRRLAKP